MGAGWQQREHEHYGWQLLDIPGRIARFQEGLEVVTRLLNSNQPVDFAGEYYTLREATLLPRPQRVGGPPILIGGNGYHRTLPLAARYATEWNGIFLTPARIRELNTRLDELLNVEGRQPESLRRSLMTGTIFGRDEREMAQKLGQRSLSADELRGRGLLVGTGNEIVTQLGELADAGIYRVMMQWLDLDDIDGLEALAHTVLPQVTA
jgi:alkanesulfonate monooxygenase SsuD/methylene tetrahydromethanopterin reductase-like flavin-dependent oxidoreductase (luciferase family)